MKRCIIFLVALLLSAPAVAATWLPIFVATPVSYQGPGDIVSGATAWWGLRAYNAAYATAGSNAIAVRNTATSETCNVPVTSSGGLGNVAGCSGSSSGDTLAVFCAESSGTCAITEFFDQTGNGHNLTQSTTADQPTLNLSCLGSLPCAAGNGSSMYMTGTAPGGSPTAFAFSVVAEKTSSATEAGLVNLGSNNPEFYYCCADGSIRLLGASGFTASVSDNAWHALQGTINGASSFIYVDTTQTTGSIASLATLGTLDVMAESGGSHPLPGNITEVGIWSSAFTTTNATNLCHNQYSYWGTSVSC